MSREAASESKLGKLHDKLADLFIEALDMDDVSPQMVNAARAFLKDNDIVCIPSEDNRVNTLGNKLKEFRKDSTKRFKDAEGEAGNVVPITATR